MATRNWPVRLGRCKQIVGWKQIGFDQQEGRGIHCCEGACLSTMRVSDRCLYIHHRSSLTNWTFHSWRLLLRMLQTSNSLSLQWPNKLKTGTMNSWNPASCSQFVYFSVWEPLQPSRELESHRWLHLVKQSTRPLKEAAAELYNIGLPVRGILSPFSILLLPSVCLYPTVFF